MQKQKAPWNLFFIYSSFAALIAILMLGGMMLSPSEPANSVFLGLSLPRLALAAGLFVVFAFFAFLALRAVRDPEWAAQTAEKWFGRNLLGQSVAWLAGISLGLGWIGCFLPLYRAGILGVYGERIRLVMVFILFVSLATLAMNFFKQSNFAAIDREISKTYRLSLIPFFLSLLLLGIMFYTDFGVYAPEDYWYGAGVPILIPQLIVALMGGVLFLHAQMGLSSGRLDLVVFLSIFCVTAILWAREPLQESFLFIGPYAPNRALYPFADGALYDTASQFALIGQNFLFYNGPFFERALYASFLVFLHSLLGQDYGHLMAAQAAIFAVFPGLVYLIGRSLNVHAVGFAAALVAMFRGANSIAASNMIDMANPKMMLTDFPTAIATALIVWLTCEWLRKPQQRWHYALWIGGIIGLSIMLRTNALVFLILVPLLVSVSLPFHWKRLVTSSLLIMIAVLAVTLPWEMRNQSMGGTMYSSFLTKFQSVIDLRYRRPMPPESSLPRENVWSVVSLKQTQVLLETYKAAGPIQEFSCNTVLCFVPNHFLHNVLTSVLVLPTSLVLDDLRTTVRESHPYWRPDWDGMFPGATVVFFVLNVFFIVLGITLAWRQHRLIGLVPLATFLFYNLTNGFARTSGGRYIVPIDWIVILYFMFGVYQTIIVAANALGMNWMLFAESGEQPSSGKSLVRTDFSKGLVILAVLFGLGSLIPLAENVYANRYQSMDVSHALAEHETQLASAGLSLQDINSFLQNPGAEISVGRALYPRYYPEFQGEVHFYPVVVMGFPRTTFTLIGNEGEKGIVLPGDKPDHFPHAADILVLGCREKFYVDALAVIILDEKGAVYTRSPASSLECPLKQPVCDNNHNCY